MKLVTTSLLEPKVMIVCTRIKTYSLDTGRSDPMQFGDLVFEPVIGVPQGDESTPDPDLDISPDNVLARDSW